MKKAEDEMSLAIIAFKSDSTPCLFLETAAVPLSFGGQTASAAADKINRLSAVIIRRRGQSVLQYCVNVFPVCLLNDGVLY